MKKALLISLAILACLAPSASGSQAPDTTLASGSGSQTSYSGPASASGGQGPYNVLLAGGAEANSIYIWLTPDGREYVIDSVATLEVGGGVCANPPGQSNRIVCQAPRVRSFMVNAAGGDDVIVTDKKVPIPVILAGGPGNDELFGGGGNDRYCTDSSSANKLCGLIGGPGNDKLVGRGGEDWLFGGPGDDLVIGGPGSDLLNGGPGLDEIRSRADDQVTQ